MKFKDGFEKIAMTPKRIAELATSGLTKRMLYCAIKFPNKVMEGTIFTLGVCG